MNLTPLLHVLLYDMHFVKVFQFAQAIIPIENFSFQAAERLSESEDIEAADTSECAKRQRDTEQCSEHNP